MYITVFDLLSKRFPRWSNISPANRAVIIGPLIVAVLLLLGGTAIVTEYHYVPLMILGVFCGAVVAKVLGNNFLAPQIQSHLTVFLGGVTTVNIGSSGAGLRKLITGTADQIGKLVALIPASAGDISGATTLGLWVALLTALVILGANAYFANQASSKVGNRIDAVPAVATSIGSNAVQS